MKFVLCFDSVEEFSLFICSAANLDFQKMPPKRAVDLGRHLPWDLYSPLLGHVTEVHVAGVTYEVTADRGRVESVEYKVVNFMLNEDHLEYDSIWVIHDGVELRGSKDVREAMEKLPRSLSLKAGWRTEYHMYTFLRK